MNSLIEDSQQPAAVYHRKSGKFIECNLKLAKLFGYSCEEEWLALNFVEYLHQDQFNEQTPEETIASIFRHFETNDIHFDSVVGVRKNGEKFIVEIFAIKNYLNYGAGSVFFFKEIDQQYLINKVALDSNIIYQTLINSSFDFIDIVEVSIIDRAKFMYEAKVLNRNENMRQTLGITDETLINMDEIKKFTPVDFWEENSNQFIDLVLKLREDKTVSFNWRFNRKDGKIVYLNIGIYSIQFNEQFVLVRIMRDITKSIENEILIKEQNKKLLKKNKELEDYIQSNFQLQNFAQIASHDIKAPLRSITSFSQILNKKIHNKLSEQEKELFQFIIKGTQDLSNLVDDLLNFSKITTQNLVIEEINTNELLSILQRDLSSLIEESNTKILIKELPEHFMGDFTKIKRVFQNIIQNGIKFSHKINTPLIEISGYQDEWYYYFRVKDNGIGIEEEMQKDVFKMFRRLNGQKYMGSGMGMAVSKKIIEQHQGNIWIESEIGKGACFHFSLKKQL